MFEGNELLWGTITLGLSSSTHTFYKHRQDSSFNLVHHTVSHCVTPCHTVTALAGSSPQLTAFFTVLHHFYSLRAETFVRGREGGRDTMRERDIERDTEKNRVRERMRKKEGGME